MVTRRPHTHLATQLEDLQARADVLTRDWGAPRVRVARNGRLRTTAGRAVHRTRTVELAGWLFDAPCDEVIETLRHEVAHVIAHDLAPRERPHGRVWRAVAVALGGRPRARYDTALAKHWSRVFYYACIRGCQIARRTPFDRRRLRRTVCASHRLPLAPVSDEA